MQSWNILTLIFEECSHINGRADREARFFRAHAFPEGGVFHFAEIKSD